MVRYWQPILDFSPIVLLHPDTHWPPSQTSPLPHCTRGSYPLPSAKQVSCIFTDAQRVVPGEHTAPAGTQLAFWQVSLASHVSVTSNCPIWQLSIWLPAQRRWPAAQLSGTVVSG